MERIWYSIVDIRPRCAPLGPLLCLCLRIRRLHQRLWAQPEAGLRGEHTTDIDSPAVGHQSALRICACLCGRMAKSQSDTKDRFRQGRESKQIRNLG